MKTLRRQQQAGYMLILMVLGLMGVGGVVLAGFTQKAKYDVDQWRYLHNQRVLEEAKQALLFYAFNYPSLSNNAQGPGRLPCPDVNNDGDQDTGFGDCRSVGRLPWAEPGLNLYDIRDADGQRLWYAVSESFGATVNNGINSDTDGTLSLRDQSGNFIFNGSIPPAVDGRSTGVAAVIIAPGAITERNGVVQDRSVANGDDPFDYTEADNSDRDTDPGIVDPVNYLDQYFGIEDNAALVQGGTNGFINGPIDDLAADSIRVNDQVVVITAAEVVAMAEKAVLKAYRDAILDYDNRIDNDIGAGDHYPWLYNYAVNDYGSGYPELNDYPSETVFANERANYLDNYGRVPSPYTTYFTETESQPIESHIGFDIPLRLPAAPVAFNPALPGGVATPSNIFDGTTRTVGKTSIDPMTFVQFEDIDPNVFSANDGRLIATVETSENFLAAQLFFWDEKPVGNGWTLCAGGGNQPSDCTRDAAGVNIPQLSPNVTASQVLRVDLEVDFEPAPVTAASISFANVNPDVISDAGGGFGNFIDGDIVRIEDSTGNDGVYRVANATAGALTLDAAEELSNEAAGATVTVSRVIQFVIDYAAQPATTVVDAPGANRHANIQGTVAGGNVDVGSLPILVEYQYDHTYMNSFDDIQSGRMILGDLVAAGPLDLTLRYYPELPDWVFEDGWYDAVQMAYANDYRPDVGAGPCTQGVDCLEVNNLAGNNDDKVSILVLGGGHDWNDGGAAGLADDIGDIFDPENDDLDPQFDAASSGGNDTIEVVEEL